MSKVKESKADIVMAASFIIISIFVFITASSFPHEAGTFPKLVSVITGVLAIGQLLSSGIAVSRSAKAVDVTKQVHKKPFNKSFWITVAGLIFYPALIFVIGYFPATLLYLAVSIYLFGYTKKLRVVFITVGTAVFLYIMFVVFLQVTLPAGLLLGGI